MNLDDDLRSALRRREPSPGFTDRVIARARGSAPAASTNWRDRRIHFFTPRRLYWGTACVFTVFLLVAGGMDYRHRRQAERAKQQVMLALEIAGTKFSYAQQRVLESMVNP